MKLIHFLSVDLAMRASSIGSGWSSRAIHKEVIIVTAKVWLRLQMWAPHSAGNTQKARVSVQRVNGVQPAACQPRNHNGTQTEAIQSPHSIITVA